MKRMINNWTAALWPSASACIALVLGACASVTGPSANPLPSGAEYVAMGSSFAAGPGVGAPSQTPSGRCARSADNYAQQLARKRKLHLVDVSCSGATTADVLNPSGDLPAQIDALSPDTALVTVTIGGNDVGFIAGLFAGSCTGDSAPVERSTAVTKMCSAIMKMRTAAAAQGPNPIVVRPDEAAWKRVESGLDRIAQEVRRRSPRARLIFVDYVTVVPSDRTCPQLPLSPEAADEARATAARLVDMTSAVAKRAGADVVHASDLTREHDVCAADPWVSGMAPVGDARRFAPYHPKLEAMSAIAETLDKLLASSP